MAKNGGSRRSRKGSKTGRKTGGSGAPGVANKIVPWNTLMRLTDSVQLPVLPEQIFRVVQSATFTNWIVPSGTLTVGAAYAAQLSQFSDNLSSLTGLFDQYKIDTIECWLKPSKGVVQGGSSDYQLFTALDYDSATVLSTPAQINGYATCIESNPGETQRRCYHPRIAYATYGSGAFTSYGNAQASWIDCAYATVQHFGMLALVTATSSNSDGYDLQVRAHISFRSTH